MVSSAETTWLERAELIGGEPCLDFINSVANRAGPEAAERLCSYRDLLFWLQRCGLLPADEAARLARARGGDKALARALAFRDAAWCVLWAVAHGEAAAESDVRKVGRYVQRLRHQTGIQSTQEGFCRIWQGHAHDPERAMWRTAIAMEALLLSDELPRLRGCAGEHCGWLFVDRSRNGMRRWCSMGDCGNRAKARKHYQRVRGKTRTGGSRGDAGNGDA